MDTIEITSEETASEKPGAEAPVTETAPSEKPAGLPEKFESVDELVKSYQELEKKLGTTSPEETPKAEKESLEIGEQAANSAGLDMDALVQEYQTDGQLSDTTYEKFEKVGITKEYVDTYIAGQEALQQRQSSEIKSTVGGDEAYSKLVTWASDNLNAAEQEAYNNAVNSGDMETVKLAVSGLQARYVSNTGSEPNLLDGKTSTPASPGYDSWAQVTAAMADPRYEKDSAYRNEVQNKLKGSNL